ncbi:MAG: adenylate/guanylate cyclase domain-containing protein [Bacteroidales bacterium]|nr:adenylate/guanylate cyclase domain-containing protein [Bacteroidales bacterium]
MPIFSKPALRSKPGLRTEKLIAENEKLHAVVANMFPEAVVEELMAGGKISRLKHDSVTVMFSDICGFSAIAQGMEPETLIDELDKLFLVFDSVVEKHGIEKIKTIGDAYMCAGGIFDAGSGMASAIATVLAAIEMTEHVRRLKENGNNSRIKPWDIRIGIHTGAVMAGTMGQKRISYDIWGDTVNTASHMESLSEAGKINISGATFKLVNDFFDCTCRGKIPVKYRGELEMYFVNGIKPELCDSSGMPNGMFHEKLSMPGMNG